MMNHLLAFHQKKAAPATQTVVTIDFADLKLLLPIAAVAKIIPLPEVRLSAQRLLGLATVEAEQVIVLDLHYPLYGRNNPALFADRVAAPAAAGYLILLAGSAGLQYGIATASLPLIESIALAQIQPWAGTEPLPANHEFAAQFVNHAVTRPAGKPSAAAITAGRLPTALPPVMTPIVALPRLVVDLPRLIQVVRQWAAA
jgi:hypothetical protein